MGLEAGQVIYTRQIINRGKEFVARFTLKPKIEAVCLVLGAIEPKSKNHRELNKDDYVALLGAVGYFPGDLITEVFGEAGWKKFETAWKNQYDKPAVPA